jgi:tRNA modification GTPase
LIDTAGLRETSDEVERLGTERARRARDSADLTLLVLDASAPLDADDRDMLTSLPDNATVALNKQDQAIPMSANDRAQLARVAPIAVSAKTGEGLSALKAALLQKIPRESNENENSSVVTNVRHVNHLEKARAELAQTIVAFENGESEETAALPLRGALQELGMITGETVTEDVLSSIFRQFCIGK